VGQLVEPLEPDCGDLEALGCRPSRNSLALPSRNSLVRRALILVSTRSRLHPHAELDRLPGGSGATRLRLPRR
jgi:hypothetical protein